MLREYAFKAAPYPASRDLIRHLRAEAAAEHQQLITDVFEKIALYEVKVTGAEKRRRGDGQWDVTNTRVDRNSEDNVATVGLQP